MRIHIHSAGVTHDRAHRPLMLAQQLAQTGHQLTLSPAAQPGEHEGVRLLGPDDPCPDADMLICVETSRPVGPTFHRTIFWSTSAHLPHTAGWHAIVAVSDHHAALLRQRLPRAHVVVIPDGINAAQPAPAADRDRFLYVSPPDRGLLRLLAIWPALWQRYGLPLSITGDLRGMLHHYADAAGPIAACLRHVAMLLDQPGGVVHGPLRSDQLSALHNRSHAVLYPLDPVAPHTELSALHVLDCCAAGVPAVVSPVDALPTLLADTARFVHSYQPQAWLDAVDDVMQARDTWVQRGLTRVLTQTTASATAAWLSLLDTTPTEPPDVPELPPPQADQTWTPPMLLP